MEGLSLESPSFGRRLTLAWRVLFDAAFARDLMAPRAPVEPAPAPKPASAPAPAPALLPPPPVAVVPTLPPERQHASGLGVFAALQREGRLVDFLQQDVDAFSDEDVAAAARVVHAGCRRVLQQSFELEPAVPQAEGEALTVPPGFDAQRIRLTGNVTGQPPFCGTVRHHGWVVRTIRLPAVSDSLDPRVLSAAEVELP